MAKDNFRTKQNPNADKKLKFRTPYQRRSTNEVLLRRLGHEINNLKYASAALQPLDRPGIDRICTRLEKMRISKIKNDNLTNLYKQRKKNADFLRKLGQELDKLRQEGKALQDIQVSPVERIYARLKDVRKNFLLLEKAEEKSLASSSAGVRECKRCDEVDWHAPNGDYLNKICKTCVAFYYSFALEKHKQKRQVLRDQDEWSGNASDAWEFRDAEREIVNPPPKNHCQHAEWDSDLCGPCMIRIEKDFNREFLGKKEMMMRRRMMVKMIVEGDTDVESDWD